MNGPGKWRWIVPAAVLVALAVSGSSLAAPVGQITEFATAIGQRGPGGDRRRARTGTSGSPRIHSNKIAEVNPATGAISEFATSHCQQPPTRGRAWVLTATSGSPSPSPGKIGEINPTTHAISDFAIPTTNSGPWRSSHGPNGNMWFTEGAANQIGEINPTTHAITEFPVPTSASVPVRDRRLDRTATSGSPRRRGTRSGRSTRRPCTSPSYTIPTGSASPTPSRPGPTAPCGSPSRHRATRSALIWTRRPTR